MQPNVDKSNYAYAAIAFNFGISRTLILCSLQ